MPTPGQDHTADYQQLLQEISQLMSVPEGLAPGARWVALIAVEERQREVSWLTEQIQYVGMTPGEALGRLRVHRWRSPMPCGPRLVDV